MKVTFSNFRCLKETTLGLSPLTVIVGANASGKTAIAKALDPSIRVTSNDVWQRRSGLELTIERTFANKGISRTLLRDGATVYEKNEFFVKYTYQYLRLDLVYLRQANELRQETHLTQHGSNLTNVFATLTRSTQAKLAAELCRLVPVFSDVVATPLEAGKHRLRFQDRWNPEVWYEPEQVSDGSILLLALLTIQYQSPSVDVVAIEEPEHCLHPYLVGEVVQMLRRLALGELGGRNIKVVVTTHSPEVLQFTEPEEVRFLDRREDGSVVVTAPPTASGEWERAYQEYGRNLGSIWLSGGLGGVPSG